MTYSRETYLQDVAAWRAEYNALSDRIRQQRALYRGAARTFSKSGGSYNKEWIALQDAWSGLLALRQRATEELGHRQHLKERAHEQVLMSHSQSKSQA